MLNQERDNEITSFNLFNDNLELFLDVHNMKYSKKELFLKKLKSKNGNYKRYLGSTLRYGGGKSLATGKILELIPENIKLLVSPFFGGGSVEIAVAKELGINVIGYDIFDILVNFWDQQINNSKNLYKELLKLKPAKKEYERVKNILKKHWNKIDGYDGKLSPLLLAAYYYFNHNLSYGPGFLGWMSSNYLSEKKYDKMIQKIAEFNVKNIKINRDSFENVLVKHRKDFLYLDPPYFLEGDSKMFKGIYPMRNFPIHHDNFRHDLLVELLKKHEGGFILSYNDCTWVREAYKDFKIVEVSWQYTMGQG